MRNQRCYAVELARIWFPDPLVAATLLNGLPSKVAADMAAELHHRFSDRVQGDLDRLRDLAVRGAELGLDEKVLSWWYDLDARPAV